MTDIRKADAVDWDWIESETTRSIPVAAHHRALIELRARVAALENEQRAQDKLNQLIRWPRAASDAPRSDELVRRVAQRLAAVFEDGPYVKGAARWDKTAARAAIREVAAWFTTIAPHGSEAWRMASEVLLQEAGND